MKMNEPIRNHYRSDDDVEYVICISLEREIYMLNYAVNVKIILFNRLASYIVFRSIAEVFSMIKS